MAKKLLAEIKEKVTDDAVDKIYNHFVKKKPGVVSPYNEEKHCKLLIKVMLDPEKGRISSFCVEAMISDRTFDKWVNRHDNFRSIYYFSKMIAREIWEDEGRKIRDEDYPMGTINYKFEHWKMIGWSRFGISRNSKVKLNLDPTETPAQHYACLLKQASEGEFTSAEFKQLMEAINVGINVFHTFALQKEIDELKLNLSTMQANSNVKNPFSNKGTKEDN